MALLQHGYTIVEVMIFIAISTALFVMIGVTFTRQQGRANFTTSVRDIESRVQDIVNDVSTGYYNRPDDFNCTAASSGPQITSGSAAQGTNQGCIFIGRVAHFAGLAAGQYNVYSVVGLRQTQIGPKREVSNFAEAHPTVLTGNAIQHEQIPGGAVIHSMYYQPTSGGTKLPIDGVGFFSSLGSYNNGVLQSGSLQVRVVPIIGTGSPGSTEGEMITLVNGISDAYATYVGNPEGRTVICMNGTGTNQYAELTIGGKDRQLATDMVVLEGSCPNL